MARIIYSEEFRLEAVNQVIKNGYSIADTANRLGVNSNSPLLDLGLLLKKLLYHNRTYF